MSIKRREFLNKACMACSALVVPAVITSTLSSCSKKISSPDQGSATTKKIFVNKSEMIGVESKVVQSSNGKVAVLLTKISENEYKALAMRCTHMGGKLELSGNQLQCPLHGSKFSNKGDVVNGPAKNALYVYPTTVEGDKISIDIS